VLLCKRRERERLPRLQAAQLLLLHLQARGPADSAKQERARGCSSCAKPQPQQAPPSLPCSHRAPADLTSYTACCRSGWSSSRPRCSFSLLPLVFRSRTALCQMPNAFQRLRERQCVAR
jgi:hypothetical protein